MNRHTTFVVSALVALVFTTCGEAHGLNLVVDNRSALDATLEIVAGTDGEPVADPFVHVSHVVEVGSEAELRLERPGPGGWTILVDDGAITDSDDWPRDNPTLDFRIVIGEDGSVSLEDT